MTVLTCPSQRQLLDFLLGRLADEPVRAIEDHVPACAACQAALTRLDAVHDLLLRQLRQASQPDPLLSEQELSQLLPRLENLATSATISTVDNLHTSAPETPAPVADLVPGTCLGRYRILDRLGQGGMGTVYRAHDPQLNRTVALKVPHFDRTGPDHTARMQRFLREARLAAAVRHAHVCPVYDVGERDGSPFVVMALVEGQSLADLIRQGRLEVSRAAELARKVALGLEAVHAQGLVHRDLKPGNVLIDAAGEPLLTDFGLARLQTDDTHLTTSGAIVGTPAYMAPEQARGKPVDHRADLFSLGVLLYEMTTGRRPFIGEDTLSVLTSLAVDEPTPPGQVNAALPAELSALILQLLAKSPQDRPPSARAVAEALTAILDRLGGPKAAPPAPEPRAAPGLPGWRLPLAVAAGLLLVIGGGALLYQVIIVRDRDGNEVARVKVPRDGKFEVVNEGKKPGEKKPAKGEPGALAPGGDPDRKAAEYVLSIGGGIRVLVKDEERAPNNAAELPKEPFQLTTVYLAENQKVTDAGLAHLKDCKNLWGLYLNNTKVTDAGLAHFKDCKNLTSIDLSHTRVTDAVLAHFKDCKNLTDLNLVGTPVTDAGLAHFKDCKNLTSIDLSHTRVTDAVLDVLIGLPNLIEVRITNTRVSRHGYEQLEATLPKCQIDWSEPNRMAAEQVLALGGSVEIAAPGKEAHPVKPGEALPRKFFQLRRVVLRDGKKPLDDLPATLALLTFAELDRLESIDLSGTPVGDLGFLAPVHGLQDVALVKSGIGGDKLAALPKLKRLVLDGNAIGRAGLENLVRQSDITELTLTDAGLADEDVARFPKLPKLKRLVLDGNPIRGPGLVALHDLPELRDLSLACPTLTDLGTRNLAGLKQLTRLSLAGTALTDAGLKHLEGLTSLRELDLRGTKATAEGVAALQKALPKCTIESGPFGDAPGRRRPGG